MNTTKFQDMIGKVRGLLAKADATDFPEEAKSLRAMAEALQFKYKIDLATAPEEERRAAHGFKPEWRMICVCRYDNEFRNYYMGIARALIDHVDSRAVGVRRVDDGVMNQYIKICGFSHDLDYLELLLVGAATAFGKQMEPNKDSAQSEAMNAYRLRMGGMERHRIATELWGPQEHRMDPTMSRWSDGYDEQKRRVSNEFKSRNRKVTSLIKKGATEAGEKWEEVLGRGNSIKTFRDSYASGFYWSLQDRLRNMALSRGESDKGLVLKSLSDQVEEMFFEEYPNLREGQTGRAPYIPPNKNCDRCKAAKSGYCREHGYLRPSTAKPKHTPFNHRAAERGEDAARTVDLGPGGQAKAEAGAPRTELA